MTKCYICGEEILISEFEDHVRLCIFMDAYSKSFFRDEKGQDRFYEAVNNIKRELGHTYVVEFLIHFKPVQYPFPVIMDSLNEGLQSQSGTFYSNTILLLQKFYNTLQSLFMFEAGELTNKEHLLASLVELFNNIYKNNNQSYLGELKSKVEFIAKHYEDRIEHLHYDHLKQSMHIQSLTDNLKWCKFIDNETQLPEVLNEDSIRQLIKENFEKKPVRDVYIPLLKLLEYKPLFKEELHLEINDFLSYLLNQEDLAVFQELNKIHSRKYGIAMKGQPTFGRTMLGYCIFFDDSKRITELRFRGLRLKKVPDIISKLTHLEIFDLRSNKLESLPKFLSEMKSLKVLYLDRNNLSSFLDSYDFPQSLEFLSIAHINFETIPEGIYQLKRLKYLGIDYDLIKEPKNWTTFSEKSKKLKLKELGLWITKRRDIKFFKRKGKKFKQASYSQMKYIKLNEWD